MSKAIDFFEDLEKREKEIFNALCTKELEGIKTAELVQWIFN